MSQGRVRYHVLAQSNWDAYTTSGDPATQTFIRQNVHRLGTFTPFFDPMLSWMPQAYCYRDAYAIYVDQSQTPNGADHPELVARDVNGQALYIPWGGPPYPQYAGDVSSPAFREFMIDYFKNTVANDGRTYGGLWVDDVNLEPRLCDAAGNPATAIDSQTGKPMNAETWALRFAEYLELLRSALPFTTSVVHNAIWTTPAGSPLNRQIAACDYFYLERGYSDDGLSGGTGQYSLYAFMNFIDHVHKLGAAVMLGEYYAANAMYGTAGYLLTNRGFDMIGFADLVPDPAVWPAVLRTDLGFALEARREAEPGIWSRQFQRGAVYLAEPGAAKQRVYLPSVMIDQAGNEVSSVTLQSKQAAVLRTLEER